MIPLHANHYVHKFPMGKSHPYTNEANTTYHLFYPVDSSIPFIGSDEGAVIIGATNSAVTMMPVMVKSRYNWDDQNLTVKELRYWIDDDNEEGYVTLVVPNVPKEFLETTIEFDPAEHINYLNLYGVHKFSVCAVNSAGFTSETNITYFERTPAAARWLTDRDATLVSSPQTIGDLTFRAENGSVTIECPQEVLADQSSVSLYTLNGQELTTIVADTSEGLHETIALDLPPRTTVIVRVASGTHIFSGKFMTN